MKKTIRLGSFLLAFLLLVCTLPVTACAASTSYDLSRALFHSAETQKHVVSYAKGEKATLTFTPQYTAEYTLSFFVHNPNGESGRNAHASLTFPGGKVQEGEYDPKDYLPVSDKDIDQMYEELKGLIASTKEVHLKKLLESFFVEDADFEKRFKFHSAAKTVHHGFVGGLLEHSLSVAKHCDYFAGCYPMLNRDLLITAAIFHDIGKLEELSTFPENDYTDDGQLLGHIIIGTEMVGDRIRTIPDFPKGLASELKHCILAHHGELEFGSPKKPALPEALALSFADNIDAKMETVREIFNNVPENNQEWQGYNRLLESNIRRSGKL